MSATHHLQSLVAKDWHAATHHHFTNALDNDARAQVTATFTQAVRLERAFFDASWAGFAVAK